MNSVEGYEVNPEYTALDNTNIENVIQEFINAEVVTDESPKSNEGWVCFHEGKPNEQYWTWSKTSPIPT